MSAGALWLLAGILLCGAELLCPGVFLLWIGLAAIAAGGITVALAPDLWVQIAAFAVLLAAALWIPVHWHLGRGGRSGGINAPDAGLVGQSCRALAFAGREGRVTFRDGAWSARTSDGSCPKPGTILRIVALDGTTLVVTADA